MTRSLLAAAPLIAALACTATDPTPLAEVGPVSATVDYTLADDGVYGARVALTPEWACPELTATATLNGERMNAYSAGVMVAGLEAGVPTTTCVPPEFRLGTLGLDEAMADGFDFSLADETDAWAITLADGFDLGFVLADPSATTVHPGDSVAFFVNGDGAVDPAGIEFYFSGRGVVDPGPAVNVSDTGVVSLEVPEEWRGPVEVDLFATTSTPVTACEGFTACTASVFVSTTITLDVLAR